ncbi:MAG TPA: prepilin-type N-terminal cleavage/methylation domain-containing protein [Verrucomicrobiae bacterium]
MRRQAGFTLIEVMFSLAIVVVVSVGALSMLVFTSRTFAGIGNYVQINTQSREAMDLMSRDIRQAAALTNATSTSLTFTNTDGSLLQYQYDPASHVLYYTNGATGQSGTLLKNCFECTFSLLQSSPVPGSCMLFTNTAVPANCKAIVLNWICRTTNVLSVNSEAMETTRIVLRN